MLNRNGLRRRHDRPQIMSLVADGSRSLRVWETIGLVDLLLLLVRSIVWGRNLSWNITVIGRFLTGDQWSKDSFCLSDVDISWSGVQNLLLSLFTCRFKSMSLLMFSHMRNSLFWLSIWVVLHYGILSSTSLLSAGHFDGLWLGNVLIESLFLVLTFILLDGRKWS